MLTLKDDYYQDIYKQLLDLFKSVYFDPIIELFPKENTIKSLYNSSNTLIEAINNGKIRIKDNIISGKFNLALSKELSNFAKFDGRSKTFKIKNITMLPSDIKTASFIANERIKRLYAELNKRTQFMSAEMKKRLKSLKFDINKTADQIESYLREDFKKLGITPSLSANVKDKLSKDYNKNMKLSIVDENNPEKDWNNEQVERLRNMVEKSAMEGLNQKQLLEYIQNEFETSKAKALFLSRQETSLFLSTLRDERYKDAGIDLYMWLSSNDLRTVGFPGGLYKPNDAHGDHYNFSHKICKFSDSSVYADNIDQALKGIWKSRSNIGMDDSSPGRAFGCRCVAKAIVL